MASAHATPTAAKREVQAPAEQPGGPASHTPPPTPARRSNGRALSPSLLSSPRGSEDTAPVIDQAVVRDDSRATQNPQALQVPNGAGAFRSRPRHRSAKSTGTRTSLSSMPVIVRTYSGSRSRQSSEVRSQSAMATDRRAGNPSLPKVEDFAFQNILRAVDEDVRTAIDAIAEICAKSRMSLADEYGAHLPPQGEITAEARAHHAARGHRTTATEHSLPALPEASSSNERLAGDSRASTVSGKGKETAYGSLKNIIIGSTKGEPADGPIGAKNLRSKSLPLPSLVSGEVLIAPETESGAHPPAHQRSASWAFLGVQHPAIALAPGEAASPLVSMDSTANINGKSTDNAAAPSINRKAVSLNVPRSRSNPIASWLPWGKRQSGPSVPSLGDSHAAMKLKDLLQPASLARNRAVTGAG
ncbi:hypothetical protein H2199_006327 [Coniosporium tulheliwenetii]|uniref:Uncharacterized protein n=1 Tax=Coniosporium tulheliwenetii TaxID=3383036 RepID=A0ACC2YYK8_9PEZI|nr:hypothetical protein H2199_006327 [Cladosporium sp. JES 115]